MAPPADDEEGSVSAELSELQPAMNPHDATKTSVVHDTFQFVRACIDIYDSPEWIGGSLKYRVSSKNRQFSALVSAGGWWSTSGSPPPRW